jgi:hypothetical protein
MLLSSHHHPRTTDCQNKEIIKVKTKTRTQTGSVGRAQHSDQLIVRALRCGQEYYYTTTKP